MFVRSILFQRIQLVLAVKMWCILHSALVVLWHRLLGIPENMRRTKRTFAARLEWHLAPHKSFNEGLEQSQIMASLGVSGKNNACNCWIVVAVTYLNNIVNIHRPKYMSLTSN